MRPTWMIVICTVILPAGSWAARTPQPRLPELIPAGRVVTLLEAVDLALANQPTVRVAAAQARFESGVVRQSRSALLPAININGSTSLAGSSENAATTTTIAGDQLLYDFNRTRNLLTQSQYLERAAVYGLGAARSDVIFNTKQAYYTALRTAQLVRVFDENLRAQEEHVAQAQARLDAGLAPRSDVLRAAAAAASARVNLVTAQNNAAQAMVDLNIAMGVDVRSATQVQDTAEPQGPVPGLDEAVNAAITNRPEMRQSLDQVAAAIAALRSAEKGNYPAFTTSIESFDQIGGGLRSRNSWEWLLNLRWTPFDSGFTRGAITEAQAQVEIADENLYTTRQTVSRDVVAARLDLLAAQESLAAAIAEVASAREDVAAATGRYEAGVGILLDVLDAQAGLLKAQVDEAVARYGMSIARAALERATGATAVVPASVTANTAVTAAVGGKAQ